MAARPPGADENTGTEEVVGEPDPVAEQGPLRERARGVHRYHADGAILFADLPDQRGDQARLADAGWARDADRVRAPRLGIDVMDEVVGERIAVLDQGDRPGECAPVARANALRERLPRPVPPPVHRLR